MALSMRKTHDRHRSGSLEFIYSLHISIASCGAISRKLRSPPCRSLPRSGILPMVLRGGSDFISPSATIISHVPLRPASSRSLAVNTLLSIGFPKICGCRWLKTSGIFVAGKVHSREIAQLCPLSGHVPASPSISIQRGIGPAQDRCLRGRGSGLNPSHVVSELARAAPVAVPSCTGQGPVHALLSMDGPRFLPNQASIAPWRSTVSFCRSDRRP